MSCEDPDLPSHAELVHLARRRAVVNQASVAPAVVGQVWSAVLRRNWWSAAGWALRGIDVMLIDLGRVRDAETARGEPVCHLRDRPRLTTRTPVHIGTAASAAVHLGVGWTTRRRFRHEFPAARGGAWSFVQQVHQGGRGVAFVTAAAAGLAVRTLVPPAVRPGR